VGVRCAVSVGAFLQSNFGEGDEHCSEGFGTSNIFGAYNARRYESRGVTRPILGLLKPP